MSETTITQRYHFTTRDLLIMAVLAGLGGVASTAINTLGASMRAVLGFSGTTQWAAGLHVVFLLLAVGLTGRGGAATTAGLLKGAVELLSGNTHGVIVLLINVAAGLIIDLVFFALGRRQARWIYILAGGLATASNVFIFQLIATAPDEVLAFIWGIAGISFLSGALLGGLLAYSLLSILRRNGLVRAPTARRSSYAYPIALAMVALVTLAGGAYLTQSLAGPPAVAITGAGAAPYAFSVADGGFEPVALQLTLQGMRRDVVGIPLREVIARAEPDADANAVLISATDGYSFFITLHEVYANDELLLAYRGEGDDLRYEIVGAANSKAWVRNVAEIRLVPQALVELSGNLDLAAPYDPDDWQMQMEGGRFDWGNGLQRVQGASLRDVLLQAEPGRDADVVALVSRSGETVELPLETVMQDGEVRIWNVESTEGIRFGVARTDGEIYARDVVSIVVQ
jgi:ABC-type thiamin/hydroxymethylpyrimidine transport system permease subunit